MTSDGQASADDFLVFGFSECADSFAGFGAFAVARAMRLFPESLLAIFEQVLFEEARHITFFINWWRYELARDGDPNALQRTMQRARLSRARRAARSRTPSATDRRSR